MNDNEPKFSTALYETSIGEDAHVGYPVVQLRAYDSDEGPKGKIIYAIKNQSTSLEMMPFVIDPDSGWYGKKVTSCILVSCMSCVPLQFTARLCTRRNMG